MVVSSGAAAGTLTLVDASRFGSYSDRIELASSPQLDTAPDSPPVVTTVLASLWQRDLVSLRAIRYFEFAALATGASYAITGMS